MERTFDRWLVGAGGLVALLVVAVVLTFQNTRQLDDDAEQVGHTHKVIIGLENLLSLAKDAETGQRGYIITGEDRYLEPYNTAIASINKQLDDMGRRTVDGPRVQDRIPELREHISAKLEELETTIALQKNGNIDAVRKEILTDRGKREMDAVRAIVTEMVQHEEGLLREREKKRQQTYRWTIFTGLLSGVSAVAGVVAFMVLLRRHLIARIAAAAAHAEQAERLRTTLASIGDAVVTTDSEGRITNMNATAESLTGWTCGDATGQPLEVVFRIVNEKSRQSVEDPVKKALREGVIVGLANHTILIRRDGTERPIDDSASPIRDAQGHLHGCVLVFRDITKQKRAEKALQEADRRKDEFLAILAHELRNPLAPMRNSLEVMRLAGSNAAIVEQARSMIERQLSQLVRLVDDLMDVGRISQGRIELRKEPIELAAAVQSAVETCRPLLEQMGHELTLTMPKQPIVVDADLTRLAQVFMNLLHNAAKYTEPPGRIGLTVERQGSDVLVSVRDNGIGIEADQLLRIFDMFAQADRSLEKSQGGLGIGLTLVRSIAEMHGGRVEAKSEGPGRGSEFRVRLPVLVRESGPQSTEGAEPIAKKCSLRVLIVDDNRDGTDSLAMMLKIMGNDVRTAYDGEEGVEAAREFQPDVVLLDIGMPRLNGYEACRSIRQQQGSRKIVVIAVTGWGAEEDRRRSEEAGFDRHIVKPVDPTTLMKLLADLV